MSDEKLQAGEPKGQVGSGRFLCFSLGEEEYAVPLLSVREVIAIPELTPVPQMPSYFLGLMNLRGQVISVLDLRLKLGIKSVPSPESAVIICEFANHCMGVVVDSVNSVLTPKEENLSPRPELRRDRSTDCVAAIYRAQEKLVLILDVAKAIGVADRNLDQAAFPRKTA